MFYPHTPRAAAPDISDSTKAQDALMDNLVLGSDPSACLAVGPPLDDPSPGFPYIPCFPGHNLHNMTAAMSSFSLPPHPMAQRLTQAAFNNMFICCAGIVVVLLLYCL
jgi:hypothetical protein